MIDTSDWVLVPREPTEAMLAAVWSLHASNGGEVTRQLYAAMLAAAPVLSPEHPLRDRGEPVAWMYPSSYDGRVELFPNNALWKEHGYALRHPEAVPLYASLPPARVEEGPRVKALEWVPHLALSEVMVARTASGGLYTCEPARGEEWRAIRHEVERRSIIVGDGGDREAAKAAAQADYEARIRSAILW